MENMPPRSLWLYGTAHLPNSSTQETVQHKHVWLTWGSAPRLSSPSAEPRQCPTSSESQHFIGFSGLCIRILFIYFPIWEDGTSSHLFSRLVSKGCRVTVNLAQTKGKITVSVCIPQTSVVPCDRMVTLLAPDPLQNKRVLEKHPPLQ